jgi:tyrosine-specific transport protein
MFTSFGFHSVLSSLTKFADNDKKVIKRACLFGTLIPFVVYSLWTSCIITIVYNSAPEVFNTMLTKSIEVDELINILIGITKSNIVDEAIALISFTAIITSIIGVGLPLRDLIDEDLSNMVRHKNVRKFFSILIAIFLPSVMVIPMQHIFMKLLNFSGILLSIIAIFIPVICFLKKHKSSNIQRSVKTATIVVILCIGIAVVVFGFCNIYIYAK